MSEVTDSAIVLHEPERALPAPAFTGAEMAEAFRRYRDVQKALDEAMPDQIMMIGKKPFRKKGYWRAVARAFRLKVECVSETSDHETGFVTALYRASTPSGDAADGDGACSANEKDESMATYHNVRSHAHTRAMNRAISNLVGFGEVSAEEMLDDRPPREAPAQLDLSAVKERPAHLAPGISAAQVKLVYAKLTGRARELELERADVRAGVMEAAGYDHVEDIEAQNLDRVLELIARWTPIAVADDEGVF